MPLLGVSAYGVPVPPPAPPVEHGDPRVRTRVMTVSEALHDRAQAAWRLARHRPRPPGWDEVPWAVFLLSLPPERLLRRLDWEPAIPPSAEREALPWELVELLNDQLIKECEGVLQQQIRHELEPFIGRNLVEMRSSLSSLTVQAVSRLEAIFGIPTRVEQVSVSEDHRADSLVCELDVRMGVPPTVRRVVLKVRWT